VARALGEQPVRPACAQLVLLPHRPPRLIELNLPFHGLRPAGLHRQRPQLTSPWRTAVALAKPTRRGVDLLRPRRPPPRQLLRHPGQLEVAAVLPGPPADLQAQLAELERQLGAVPRSVDACRAKQLARVDRRKAAVGALSDDDHGVRVQLRVGHPVGLLIPRQPRRGVHELRRDQKLRALPAQLAVRAAAAHQLDLVLDPSERARYRGAVRGLDLRAPVRAADRPQRRDRLWGAEGHIDPRHPRPVTADPAHELARSRRPALHHGDEIIALDSATALESQICERARRAVPTTVLAVSLTPGVVVAPPRRTGCQIGREPARRVARDLVCRDRATDRTTRPARTSRGPKRQRRSANLGALESASLNNLPRRSASEMHSVRLVCVVGSGLPSGVVL